MRSIVYSCSYVPPEWIAAHGFRPVRLVPYSGTECLQRETAGICHYMHRFLEQASQFDAAGVVVTTLCDQMRRGVECINSPSAASLSSLFLMHVPKTMNSVGAVRYYHEELKRLSRFLINLGGALPDEAHLIEVMIDYQQKRDNLFNHRSDMSGVAFSRFLRSFQAGGLLDLCEDATKSKKLIPVAILGGPMSIEDLGILDLIEEAGGEIVLDGTEGGERTMPRAFHRQRIHIDPFMELVEAYWSIPDVARRPNDSLFIWIKNQLAQRHMRGIILLRNVWCDLWHAEVMRLREWLDIPLLDIDLDGESATARNRTRIEAFMEAL
ncbi:2-hydroxyacyl-CoA dehydratase [bacterium]|nr:2-hydroxyacyl-CoA dehydratase [bacterium]